MTRGTKRERGTRKHGEGKRTNIRENVQEIQKHQTTSGKIKEKEESREEENQKRQSGKRGKQLRITRTSVKETRKKINIGKKVIKKGGGEKRACKQNKGEEAKTVLEGKKKEKKAFTPLKKKKTGRKQGIEDAEKLMAGNSEQREKNKRVQRSFERVTEGGGGRID